MSCAPLELLLANRQQALRRAERAFRNGGRGGGRSAAVRRARSDLNRATNDYRRCVAAVGRADVLAETGTTPFAVGAGAVLSPLERAWGSFMENGGAAILSGNPAAFLDAGGSMGRTSSLPPPTSAVDQIADTVGALALPAAMAGSAYLVFKAVR